MTKNLGRFEKAPQKEQEKLQSINILDICNKLQIVETGDYEFLHKGDNNKKAKIHISTDMNNYFILKTELQPHYINSIFSINDEGRLETTVFEKNEKHLGTTLDSIKGIEQLLILIDWLTIDRGSWKLKQKELVDILSVN